MKKTGWPQEASLAQGATGRPSRIQPEEEGIARTAGRERARPKGGAADERTGHHRMIGPVNSHPVGLVGLTATETTSPDRGADTGIFGHKHIVAIENAAQGLAAKVGLTIVIPCHDHVVLSINR